MLNDVHTPTARRAFANRDSEHNSPASLSARKASQATGKGRAQSTSLFKPKVALATRAVTSPKTPVVRASKGTSAHISTAPKSSPPPTRPMLTPGAIKQMRQSTNASALGRSTSLASEPSLDLTNGNTSSILSENSTLLLSHSFMLGISLNGRDSLDSERDSIGSSRNSMHFLDGEQEGQLVTLKNNSMKLKNDTKQFEVEFDQKLLSLSLQSSNPQLASPSLDTPSKNQFEWSGSPAPRILGGVGYLEEQVHQLESNCASLKEQDEKLGEMHLQLLHSLLNKDLSSSASLGDVIVATKSPGGSECLRHCDIDLVRSHIKALEAKIEMLENGHGTDVERRLLKAQEAEHELTSQLHAAQRSMLKLSRDLEEANKELRDARTFQEEAERARMDLEALQMELDDTRRMQRKGHEAQNELEMQLQAAQRSISELTKELDGARRLQEETDEQVSELEAELDTARRMQSKGEGTERELEMQLHGAQDSISSLGKDLEQARMDLEALQVELDDTRRMQRKGHEAQNELEMQLQAAQRSISELTKELDGARRLQEGTEEQVSELEAELDTARRMQSKGEGTERELEMQLHGAQDSISSLGKDLEQARMDLEALQVELDDTRRLHRKAKEIELELASHLHAAERSISQLSRDLEEAHKDLRDAISELTKELDDALRLQEEAQGRMQATVNEVQQMLEAAEAISDARYDDIRELEKTSKEEIDVLHQRVAELGEELEASRQHRRQQIAKLEEEQEALEADLQRKEEELEGSRREAQSMQERAAQLKEQLEQMDELARCLGNEHGWNATLFKSHISHTSHITPSSCVRVLASCKLEIAR